ncbi:MAG TPA: Gfo/Idh/MocA family oxidoreductase [Telluria sp.]|nr:Gfo/Idh/MocA family oxidoreductase [Telluria sp.]
MSAIRWGIFSTGKIARAFAAALRDTPGAVLAGVASRSGDKAAAFCDEFGGQPYGSYEALAAAADVDVIYIGTPHPLHAANALLALDGGKAVLCEKPFTMNRREAEAVVAKARAKKLFLMEAMWSRYLPALEAAKQVVESGEIGPVTQLTADFGFTAHVGPEHRLLNPELGGGALLDLGIYPLSLAAWFLGAVADVRAFGELRDSGIDAHTGFLLRHESGAISNCTASLRGRSPVELTVVGERGFVRVHSLFYRAQAITVEKDDGSKRTIEAPYLGNGYVHEAMEVQRCLRAGLLESPRMPLGETLHLMGVLDTIRSQIGLRYTADAS